MDRPPRPTPAALPLRAVLAPGIAAVLAAALAAGLVGGLVRAGVPLPAGWAGAWLGPAAAGHAFLMVGAVMGTVIGLERAVALRRRAGFAAPLASALAGAAWLAGAPRTAGALAVLGALAFVAVNGAVARRQRAPHTALLCVAAVAGALGHLAWAAGAGAARVVPWWLAFLVVTIAAERLEMTRLMRRRRGALASLCATLALLCGGAALSTAGLPRAGGLLYGAALLALAAWLLAFDIARRTVRAPGLPRYMALCLLSGYAWLGVAGAAWMATALGVAALRDVALHALALGFIASMAFGHAPVVVPALTRLRLRFGPAHYLPLAALHGTLLLRCAAGPWDAAARSAGALGNAAALLLFAATLAASVRPAGRRSPRAASGTPHRTPTARSDHDHPALPD
ncbi:hypothetical protein [Acidovorax sp. NCPPB 4044]|uniref:hypothetical protein n=1 Tax=Acidovorax sp. NCPPB 4044 TaxID=2940490 RepID=UPI002303CC42|nr:hypothetical protein [Acidovorax sp. NCPPB 4044]MDA8521526.1 hypothetical protein [Acidovorax sp. NCPPB 4044]